MGDLVKDLLGICGEVETLICAPMMGRECLCGLGIPGTHSCPVAPFAHSQEDFSAFLKRAAVLLLLRRGSGKVQPPSLQKC